MPLNKRLPCCLALTVSLVLGICSGCGAQQIPAGGRKPSSGGSSSVDAPWSVFTGGGKGGTGVLSSKTKIGETFIFGSYEQDNNPGNGAEPIRWRVLDKTETSALVISESILDIVRYHSSDVNYDWASSTVRRWLNSDFYETAFSESEKSYICVTTVRKDYDHPAVQNSDKRVYIFDASPPVDDRIFFLDGNQIFEYFSSDSDRQSMPTEYARHRIIEILNSSRNDWDGIEADINKRLACGGFRWWIKSDGTYQISSFFVDDDGSIHCLAASPSKVYEGVRPSMWVNFNS